MAVFGRRQPHQPIILRPTVIGAAAATPPIGQILQLSKAAQQAALLRVQRRFNPVIKTKGATPPIASPVVFRGQDQSQAAAIRARTPYVFRPTIKTLGPPPPVARQIQVSEIAQASAIFARRPLFLPIEKKIGPAPPVGKVVAPQGQATSREAALFARRPLFRPIFKTAGPSPSVAQIVTPGHQQSSREAASFAHRPLFQPITKTHGQQPPVGLIVSPKGQGDSRESSLYAHRPLFRPTTKTVGQQPPAASPFAVHGLSVSTTNALSFRQPYVFKPAIKRPGSQPSTAQVVVPRGQTVSQAAAIAGRRPFVFKPIIKSPIVLGSPIVATPIGQVVLLSRAAVAAALLSFPRPFRPIIKTKGSPAPVAGPVVVPRGQGTTQAAALRGRRPYVFKPLIRTLIQYQPSVITFIAQQPRLFGRLASQQAAIAGRRQSLFPPVPLIPVPHVRIIGVPLVNRVQDADAVGDKRRLDRFTQIVSQILNSLLLKGRIVRDGIDSWDIVRPGGHTAAVPPTPADDSSSGFTPGSLWVVTGSQAVYVCVDATTGAAVWKLIG